MATTHAARTLAAQIAELVDQGCEYPDAESKVLASAKVRRIPSGAELIQAYDELRDDQGSHTAIR